MKTAEKFGASGAATIILLLAGCAGDFDGAGPYGGAYYGEDDFYGARRFTECALKAISVSKRADRHDLYDEFAKQRTDVKHRPNCRR
jgi:hypothetical protein